MRSRVIRSAITAFAIATCSTLSEAGSFVSDPAILVDYGLFCPFDARGRSPAPETQLGEILLIDQDRKVDVTTTIIPAVLGLSFGVRLRLRPGAYYDEARIIVTHPPMGSGGLTQQIWPTAPTDAASTLDIFRFDFHHELLPGTWTLGLRVDDQVILQQEFEVVPPEQAPNLVEFCAPAALTS